MPRSKRASSSLFAAAALIACVFASTRAEAFCRTTTDRNNTVQNGQCVGTGRPIFWKNRCVGYSLEKIASRQVAYDDATRELAAAFARWAGASCVVDGAGSGRASIDVRDLGAVECANFGYNKEGENQNVIIFRDDSWPHKNSETTIALTTVTFLPSTGEIVDADMEINTFERKMSLSDTPAADGYDFPSVVTHEAGHFLGLAHSPVKDATMYFEYNQGQTNKRYLKTDDVAGICEIYRPDGTRSAEGGPAAAGATCDPLPRRGIARTCADDSTTCSAGSQTTSSSGVLASAVLLSALGVAVLRRRKSGSAAGR